MQQQIVQSATHDYSYSGTTTTVQYKAGGSTAAIPSTIEKPQAPPLWLDFKLSLILPRPTLPDASSNDERSCSLSSKSASVMSDNDYIPLPKDDEDSYSESDMSWDEDEPTDPLNDPKFIVQKEQLMSLFETCNEPGCGKPLSEPPKITFQGFALSIKSICLAGHDRVWHSQSFTKNIPVCNILLPASVLMTGGSYSTMKEIFAAANIHALSPRECYNIQSTYIIPEVNKMWTVHNEAVMSALSEKPLIPSGDARCDSPGHCATFGTYTLLDSNSHLIVAQETVCVTDAKNSYWLEPEGLIRALQQLMAHNVSISHLATDRHPGIQKLIRETYEGIDHQYDLWHIVKGVKKKTCQPAKMQR